MTGTTSRQELIDEFMETMHDRAFEHVQDAGVFIPVFEIVGAHFVVASTDYDESPELHHEPLKDALRRFKRAKSEFANGEHESLHDALDENDLFYCCH